MSLLKGCWVYLPITAVVLPLHLLGMKMVLAAEENINFTGTVYEACALSSPDKAIIYNPANSPKLMVLRCNYGKEFRVVSANEGRKLISTDSAIDNVSAFPQSTTIVLSSSVQFQPTVLNQGNNVDGSTKAVVQTIWP
jgi:hypothetical protein